MLKEHLKVIVKELQEACDGYDETNDAPIIESIMHSGKIFIAGAGRTGYIMRCFAMRLIHLGFCAYVIGDTEMIAAKAGDLLLIGSGSGETKTLRVYMESQTAGDENGCVYLQQGIRFGQRGEILLRDPRPEQISGWPDFGSADGQPF